tara:strand:+ start:13832 stop:14371 length:540 start_codon:yes stop_codon:yes gene_type:complete
MLLLVVSSAIALADEGLPEELIEDFDVVNPTEEYKPEPKVLKHPFNFEHIINRLMEKFGLNEDNTLGDLIDAIKENRREHKERIMDNLGVDSEEELREALKERNIEKLRDRFELDEDLSDEEVLEAVKAERMDLVKETLGLAEDASKEEVETAWKEWLKDNKVLLPGLNSKLHFFRNFF